MATTRHPFHVPRRFELAGRTIEVELTDRDADANVVGASSLAQGWVRVFTRGDGGSLSAERVEEIYLHEVVHLIHRTLGQRPDEAQVESFASLLHQVLTRWED